MRATVSSMRHSLQSNVLKQSKDSRSGQGGRGGQPGPSGVKDSEVQYPSRSKTSESDSESRARLRAMRSVQRSDPSRSPTLIGSARNLTVNSPVTVTRVYRHGTRPLARHRANLGLGTRTTPGPHGRGRSRPGPGRGRSVAGASDSESLEADHTLGTRWRPGRRPAPAGSGMAAKRRSSSGRRRPSVSPACCPSPGLPLSKVGVHIHAKICEIYTYASLYTAFVACLLHVSAYLCINMYHLLHAYFMQAVAYNLHVGLT